MLPNVHLAPSSRSAVFVAVALGLLARFAASSSQSGLTCETLTPCSCRLLTNASESLGIVDISSFVNYDWTNLTGQYDNNRYAFHPCTAGLELPGTECTRQNQAAVCKETNNGEFYSYGRVSTAKFEVTQYVKGEPLQLMVTYSQGTADRIAQVAMTCTAGPSTEAFAFKTNIADMVASLGVFSPCACANGCGPAVSSSGSLSPGSILLILFVIVVVLYVIIGVLYKRTVRGAQGMEMIPNHSLWVNLPSFIADGIRFLFCQFSAGRQKGGAYESL